MASKEEYERETMETLSFRTKVIDGKKKELAVRRQQAGELAAEIKKLEKGFNEYAERRAREWGRPRQLEFADQFPGWSAAGEDDALAPRVDQQAAGGIGGAAALGPAAAAEGQVQ